jgi:hypothetical protein
MRAPTDHCFFDNPSNTNSETIATAIIHNQVVLPLKKLKASSAMVIPIDKGHTAG